MGTWGSVALFGGGGWMDVWIYGNSPLCPTGHWPFGAAAQKRWKIVEIEESNRGYMNISWICYISSLILHPSYKVVRKNTDIIVSILTRIATIIPRLLIWLNPAPAVAFFITTIRSTRTRAFVIVNCSHARFVTALVISFLADSHSATFSTTAFKNTFKFVNVLWLSSVVSAKASK